MVTILFVDDQPLVLDGIRRMLIGHRREWSMRFATSGEEALRACAEARVDAIVSDMRMPEMDGATLLESVAQRHPDTIRIVLSGHSELEAALRAMDVAHQYLAKPCEGPAIANALTRTLRQRERLPQPRVRQLVNRLGALPSLPGALRRLRRLLAEPSPALGDVCAGLCHDPALAGKVLQLANSAFFGPSQCLTSVPVAASLLGMSALRHLVTNARTFDPPAVRAAVDALDTEAFERHVVTTARLAAKLEPEAAWCDDAFAAGLLHDAGVLLVAERMPDESAEIQRRVRQGVPRARAEREVIGTDHGEIAGYLFGLWGLPESIVEAVGAHVAFSPSDVEALDARRAVGVASQLATELLGDEVPGRERPSGELWDWWREQAEHGPRQEAA
ncbi:MAG: HDOD domain-containing protein [Candidatus Eisenbacteria bacterium]